MFTDYPYVECHRCKQEQGNKDRQRNTTISRIAIQRVGDAKSAQRVAATGSTDFVVCTHPPIRYVGRLDALSNRHRAPWDMTVRTIFKKPPKAEEKDDIWR
eukprot:1900862-Amphidinium_carterae.1